MSEIVLFIGLLVLLYIGVYFSWGFEHMDTQNFDRPIQKVWYADSMNSGNETIGRNRYFLIDDDYRYYWQGDYKGEPVKKMAWEEI